MSRLGYQSAANNKRKCSTARREKAGMVGKVDRVGTVDRADNRLLQPAGDTEVAEDKAAAEDTSDSSQTCWRLRSMLRSQTKLKHQDDALLRDPGVSAKTSALPNIRLWVPSNCAPSLFALINGMRPLRAKQTIGPSADESS